MSNSKNRTETVISDSLLLIKKIGVTVLIYISPVLIIVGGLYLTAKYFGASQETDTNKETIITSKP